MKRLNFNIKDRKVLTLGLCLILVCVFTLTVAYAALSAVLTISGNARVSAANWDIYLNNPRVTNGSVTTNVPEIKTSSTLEFSTTLNMPGDFYEFTVDVVNSGSIDAMIENVVKTPELTADQAKFLKYEITYQNGESITTKQLLAKDTSMPIKVRIEYRKDLNNTSLPTSQIVLDLALTLEYVQSDGTGSSVKDNGVYKVATANGDINEIGTIVTIGTEQFYTIGTEGDNVKLLSMYNLYVGGSFDRNNDIWIPYGSEATNMQDENMSGFSNSGRVFDGVTNFSDDEQKGNTPADYHGSIVEKYVNNYKAILENNFGIDVVEARLITLEEVTDPGVFACEDYGYCSMEYYWLTSTTYWIDSQISGDEAWKLHPDDDYCELGSDYAYRPTWVTTGVRPVIIISKSNF